MTTKPKAKKFRIRRSAAQIAAAEQGAGDAAQQPQERPETYAQAQQQARPAAAAQALRNAAAPRAGQPAQPVQHARPAQPQTRAPNPMEALAQEPVEDGFGQAAFPTARGGQAAQPQAQGQAQGQAMGRIEPKKIPAGDVAQPAPEAEIAAIKQEGLTGRQLRMARRVAQKHGLPATSDYDAVRLLRRAGVDPFQSANMLQLVTPEGEETDEAQPKLPQTVQPTANLPSTTVLDAAERARSIQDMQRDIAKRRQRRLMMLFTRLAIFVFLPTLMAAWYFYVVATPMYATKSEFLIQKADAGGAPGLSSLFAGSGLATSQDSMTVQSYLTSRDAMLRLDAELGFKEHFSAEGVDPIQRLETNASNEATYKVYKRNVKIGFDPTEGIMKMEVIAATPEFSGAMSEALIRFAEERVDNLTQRLRADQMAGAIKSYEDAEAQMLAAQDEVLRLQETMGVIDGATETGALMGQINTFETQLQQKSLQLQQLLDNARPNQARVDGARGDIQRLENLIAELRSKLTEGGGVGGDSLAKVSGQLTIAQTNLTTRTALMQQALQQLETARIEANKQTRYLSMGVNPVAPDTPSYPRSFENTILAFLVFAGIYLMISITASILREQVSG
ncbi:MAG: capsule biosynthesis protein [Maritimibacter sp.]